MSTTGEPGCHRHRSFNLLGCPECDAKHAERVTPSTPLFYIQDKRGTVGNSLSWWRVGGHGYACDLREAETFTEEKARELVERSGHKYRAWPKAYIDARISHHVDFQHCDPDEAMQAATTHG